MRTTGNGVTLTITDAGVTATPISGNTPCGTAEDRPPECRVVVRDGGGARLTAELERLLRGGSRISCLYIDEDAAAVGDSFPTMPDLEHLENRHPTCRFPLDARKVPSLKHVTSTAVDDRYATQFAPLRLQSLRIGGSLRELFSTADDLTILRCPRLERIAGSARSLVVQTPCSRLALKESSLGDSLQELQVLIGGRDRVPDIHAFGERHGSLRHLLAGPVTGLDGLELSSLASLWYAYLHVRTPVLRRMAASRADLLLTNGALSIFRGEERASLVAYHAGRDEGIRGSWRPPTEFWRL